MFTHENHNENNLLHGTLYTFAEHRKSHTKESHLKQFNESCAVKNAVVADKSWNHCGYVIILIFLSGGTNGRVDVDVLAHCVQVVMVTLRVSES